MKKIYLKPAINVFDIELQSIIAVSGSNIVHENGTINSNVNEASEYEGEAGAASYRSTLWQ
jgi:hypothetical protein